MGGEPTRLAEGVLAVLSGGPCREFFFSRERQSARGSCAQSLDEALLGCTGDAGAKDP